MFVSITQIVVIAVIGAIIAGVWLVRRAISDGEAQRKSPYCRACGQLKPGSGEYCGRCGARLT